MHDASSMERVYEILSEENEKHSKALERAQKRRLIPAGLADPYDRLAPVEKAERLREFAKI